MKVIVIAGIHLQCQVHILIKNFMEKIQWKSRKFIGMILFVIIGTVFVISDKVSGEYFLGSFIGVFGLYSTANIVDKNLNDGV